jgi:hypothetical protein
MSRITIAVTAAAAGLLLAACSSSPATSSDNNAAPPPSTAPATSPPASTSPPAVVSSQLNGKWSGQYTGSFTGTFTLHWHQSGSRLTGTIKLSDPSQDLPITGSVHGSHISFGAVGTVGITYSGSVSGSSMSGHYQVHDGRGDGGPWQASKA